MHRRKSIAESLKAKTLQSLGIDEEDGTRELSNFKLNLFGEEDYLLETG